MADESENSAELESAGEAESTPPAASNLPLIITLAALTLYFGSETLQGLTERVNLTAAKSNQEAAIQEAQKVQGQFKTLVGKTSQLADQGHVGARMVMEELLKRGVGAAPEAKTPSKSESKPTK
jgi:type IV secretory pathway VirB6-like protein